MNVVQFQHHKPGKGGAFMRIKLKEIKKGRTVEKTYRADEKVVQAIVEKKTKQYLYKDGDRYIFMDLEDYSQIEVDESAIGEKVNFLIEGLEVELLTYDNDVLDVELPPQIKMKVTKSDPGVKGDSVSGSTKKVQLETGLMIDVPLFIEQDENIIVDTRSNQYISRTD